MTHYRRPNDGGGCLGCLLSIVVMFVLALVIGYGLRLGLGL